MVSRTWFNLGSICTLLVCVCDYDDGGFSLGSIFVSTKETKSLNNWRECLEGYEMLSLIWLVGW